MTHEKSILVYELTEVQTSSNIFVVRMERTHVSFLAGRVEANFTGILQDAVVRHRDENLVQVRVQGHPQENEADPQVPAV